jgi:hypothetical protein
VFPRSEESVGANVVGRYAVRVTSVGAAELKPDAYAETTEIVGGTAYLLKLKRVT